MFWFSIIFISCLCHILSESATNIQHFSHIHQTFFRFYILNPLFCHSDTHGFDAGGAQTDAIGNTVEEGIWASPDDAQKFEELTQLLVNCYSAFEVMPDELPNLHNDGAFTLNENIADLGGFEIAYMAFVKYLEGKGVSGEELTKQKRHFYQAYANLWRCKYSVIYAQDRTDGDETCKDNHSLAKERINGVVSNTDDWYDLIRREEIRKGYQLAFEN